jgi:heme exporter protein B
VRPVAGADPGTVGATPGFFSSAWLIARKDLTVEFRTRTAFFSAMVFTVLGIAIFFFAWDATAVASIDLAPGVLWVVFTFSGLLALQRSFSVEQADRAMDALLASPVSREAVYAGKAVANLLFVCAIQVIAVPAVALFYNLPLGRPLIVLLGMTWLAAVGLVAVGTLFASMAVNTRLAELLLPMLSLPFFVPVVMSASYASTKLLAGRPAAEWWPWLRILIGFDIVFLVACTLAFPFTLEE